MEIRNKVVLITGASEGIGAACANAFRARGALLSLTARSEAKLRQAGGPEALITAGDLTDPAVRRSVVKRTMERHGRIDILVNNAGVGVYQAAHTADPEKARQMFELNFFAPLDMIQLVVPQMKQRQSGAIVNVGSIGGKVTLPWFTLYSASKFAIGSLTDGLRMELKRFGIHCMTVCPGYVKTSFQQNVLAGDPPQLTGLRQKWAITPEQCAEALLRGVEREARTVVTPATGWLLVAASRLFPSVVEGRLADINEKQERAS